MILNDEEVWNYIEAKHLPALSRGIMSKRHVGFYCLSCLHFFRKEKT